MAAPKLIGIYYLGHENVRLFMRDGDGGDFHLTPPDGGSAKISIGWYDGWENASSKVVEVLLHELMELSFTRLGCRFLPSPAQTNSHAAYSFMFTHEQMDVAASSVGEFVLKAIPEMHEAMRSRKKNPKRKK